jgi:hypothetical protein
MRLLQPNVKKILNRSFADMNQKMQKKIVNFSMYHVKKTCNTGDRKNEKH